MLVILFSYGAYISVMDIRCHQIRNRDNLMIGVFAYFTYFTAPMLISLLIIGISVLILAIFSTAIGMGDAKLMLALLPIAIHQGVSLGWQLWCWTLGGIWALVTQFIQGRANQRVAFAPFIFSGLFLAIWTK